MMAPKNFREILFSASTFNILSFFGNVGVVVFKYFKGTTPYDSLSEVVETYLIMM
jgi:hypothetical protein